MFNPFKKKKAILSPKNYSFESKLAVALNHFNEKGQAMLFPSGPKQAEAILKSIAKLIEVDVDELSSEQFFEILQLYSDAFIRCMMPNASDEKVVNFLLTDHKRFIHSQEIGLKVIAYIALNMKNHLFALNVYSDFEYLYSFISGTTASASTNKTLNKDDPCKEITLSVFYDAYYTILKTLEKMSIIDVRGLRVEIAYMLLAIAENAVSSNGKNSMSLRFDSRKWFYDLFRYNGLDTVLDSRLTLYKSVVEGKPLRGEWLLGNTDSIVGNPLLCCMTLFGDIIINPQCTNDYENAPIRIVGILEITSFAEVMYKKVFQVISHFAEGLHEIYYNDKSKISQDKVLTTEYSRIQKEFGNESEDVIKYWAPLYYIKSEIGSTQDKSMLSNLLASLEQIVIREKGYAMLQNIRKISRIADERKLSDEIGVVKAIQNKDPRFRWFE